jgi:hypothetical protein
MHKLTLLVAVVATAAAGSAFADDQRLEDLHARKSFEPSRTTTTVAVYTNRRGVGRTEVVQKEQVEQTRFELRSNPHGQLFGVYVANP